MASMGRKPTINLNLPPRMRARVKARGVIWYYYDTGGKPRREIPLGKEYTAAVRKWADLQTDQPERASALLTFKSVSDRYLKEVLPGKAARTQRDNLIELGWLLKFFNDPPRTPGIHQIMPYPAVPGLAWEQSKGSCKSRKGTFFTHLEYGTCMGIN